MLRTAISRHHSDKAAVGISPRGTTRVVEPPQDSDMRLETEMGATECAKRTVLMPSAFSTEVVKRFRQAREDHGMPMRATAPAFRCSGRRSSAYLQM